MMSKPFRMVMVHAGAWGTFLLIAVREPIAIGAMTMLDWTCVLIVAGCAQTIVVRLMATMRRLRGA
jgi:hypothetical protein